MIHYLQYVSTQREFPRTHIERQLMQVIVVARSITQHFTCMKYDTRVGELDPLSYRMNSRSLGNTSTQTGRFHTLT